VLDRAAQAALANVAKHTRAISALLAGVSGSS
jgi:hypothetical protein